MKLGKLAKIFAILATACLMVPSLFADNFEITRQPNAYTKPELPAQSPDRASYVGRLRVHMVEIESRWNDNAGTPFDYALLDFVIDQPFGVADGGLYSDVAIWNSQAHAFANLAEDNYAVTAVVFNGTPVTQDAFPPYGYWFNAYYADATAQATPNVIGENSIDGGYSHTVFVEEGTANWWVYCPATRAALHQIDLNGDHNFVYVAMVEDKNNLAKARLENDLNIGPFPTTYFGGGYQVLNGGVGSLTPYELRIDACGARTVPNLNLIVATRKLEGYNFEVRVRVGNGVEANNAPFAPAAPEGQSSGSVGVEYSFTAVTTDADPDEQIYYQWRWDDGQTSAWLGPYNSGQVCTATHAFDSDGSYDIMVKAKDAFGASTVWSQSSNFTTGGCCQLMGDVDDSGSRDISDLTFLIEALFAGGPYPPCMDQADVAPNGGIDISDVTVLVEALFVGGSLPSCP